MTSRRTFLLGASASVLASKLGARGVLAQPHQAQPSLGHPIAIHDPSGTALEQFRNSLEEAARGEGQARIAVYGASHTSSDQYTSYLRRMLQARFGNSGAGFVMPVRPFTYYNHRAARLEKSGGWRTLRVRGRERTPDAYGLAGFAVETSEEAWTRLSPRRRTGSVDQFDVYYYRQPGGGQFQVLIDGEQRETIRTNHESPTPGYASFRVDGGRRQLEIRTLGDGAVRLFGVSMERRAPGVIVDPFGVPGARVRDQLPWNVEVQAEHLRRRNPDLVVLAYGTNESAYERVPMATYEENLRTVLGRMESAVPRASRLLIGPSEWPSEVDGEWVSRPTTARIVEVQRRVAAETGAGFFDLTSFVGGPAAMHEWVTHDPPFAADDHIHYTEHGHRRLAEVLFRALVPRASSEETRDS